MIPYSRQTISSDDIKAVVRVLKSDWLTQGKNVSDFEESLSKYVGSKYVVVFSSGTIALQAAYFALGIKKNDQVITSPLTFAATTNALIWQGGVPVFADVLEDGNLDPVDVERKITEKTRAIVIVHYAGMPADISKFKKIAKKHNLLIIEDGAHALGAEFNGVKIGSISDMTMFSFHPVKSITTGEGGAISTNNKKYYEQLLLFRSHGITKDSKKFINKPDGEWYHEMQILGQNCRLTDFQSALGKSQLNNLDKFINIREKIALRYNTLLKDIPNLKLPKIILNRKSSWHLYTIRIINNGKINRSFVFNELRKAGIGVQVHYIPVYWHPYYASLGYIKGLCPKAEEFYSQETSLPVYPSLKVKQQDYVVKTLKNILNSNEKL